MKYSHFFPHSAWMWDLHVMDMNDDVMDCSRKWVALYPTISKAISPNNKKKISMLVANGSIWTLTFWLSVHCNPRVTWANCCHIGYLFLGLHFEKRNILSNFHFSLKHEMRVFTSKKKSTMSSNPQNSYITNVTTTMVVLQYPDNRLVCLLLVLPHDPSLTFCLLGIYK